MGKTAIKYNKIKVNLMKYVIKHRMAKNLNQLKLI